MRFLAAVLVVFQLGGFFVEPSVEGNATSSDKVQIDISVGVDAANVSTVVVHVIEPGGEQQTHALDHLGDLRFGAVFLIDPADYVVVFEALTVDDSRLSEPTTLTALGLDPALIGDGRFPVIDAGVSHQEEPNRWGWLALAAGSLSLALVALLFLAPRRPAKPDDEPGDHIPNDDDAAAVRDDATSGDRPPTG